MTTAVCLEAEDDLLLMLAICHIKGLAIEVSLKLIFRFMSGCFGDINEMDGHESSTQDDVLQAIKELLFNSRYGIA